MTVTIASFRADFPEFSDATAYPDASVSAWLGASASLVAADRWANLYDLGVELLIAHNLVMGAKDRKSASNGGAPGGASGVVASKSVDKVSVSYDTGAATFEGGGDLNTTTYGIRWLRLARMVGAGGLQV